DFLELFDQLHVDALLVVDVTGRVRARHDRAAKLVHLLHGVDGDVSRAGYDDLRAIEGTPLRRQHLLDKEHAPIAGRLRTDAGAAEGEMLARQYARLVSVGDPLVLAEKVADLSASDPDVAGRHIDVFPNVSVQLGHEALAKPHDFAVGAPLWVEVGAALAAADGQAGQCVLEDLLESEKLHRALIDRRVKTQSALVGTQSAVEFHPEPTIDLDLAVVVFPWNAEDDLAFGLADAFDNFLVRVVGILVDGRSDTFQDLTHSLRELRLSRFAVHHVCVDLFEAIMKRQTDSFLRQYGIGTPTAAMPSSHFTWRKPANQYDTGHAGPVVAAQHLSGADSGRGRRAAGLLADGVEEGLLVVGQLECGRRDVLLQVRRVAGARDGEHVPTAAERPGQPDLRRRRPVGLRDGRELGPPRLRLVLAGERARDGEERHERDAELAAPVHDGVVRAIGEPVSVLHTDDRCDRPRLVELVRRHVRHAELTHQPGLAQLGERAQMVGERA